MKEVLTHVRYEYCLEQCCLIAVYLNSIIVHSVGLVYRTCIMTACSVIIVCFDLTGGAYRGGYCIDIAYH